MKHVRRWLALPASAALLCLLLLLPATASAHEQRDVSNKYHFVVGFLNEPAIQNQMNSIDLTVTTLADKKPVEGADKTLKAEVIVGGNAASMPLPLEARFGLPGKYASYFMPTATGSYTFHIAGTINGDAIEQRFESGPNTFGDVEAIAPLEFPNKLADSADLTSQLAAARSAADSGRMMGIIGLVVGALGLATAVVALMRGRGSSGGVRGAILGPDLGAENG